MHIRTFLLLLILPSGAASAQNIYSALHHNEIREYTHGKPAQIVETNIFYSSGNIRVNKNVKTFDHTGMPLVEERYDETGKMTEKLTYINDTVTRRSLERVFERWASIGYTKEKAIYTYDALNFLTRITDVDTNGHTIGVTEIVNN